MGSHTRGRAKGDNSRARDSVGDRALVNLCRQPASLENTYLTMPQSHRAGDTGHKREPTYGRAETGEHTPSFATSRSLSFSSSSASMLGATGGQHGLNQNQQTQLPGQVRGTGKPKRLCHNWGNNGKCKFGDDCKFRHEIPPSALQEEPPEAGPAYYSSWKPGAMQRVPIVMMPAFLPQGSLDSRVQAHMIQDVAVSMDTNHVPRHRDQSHQVHDAAPSAIINRLARHSNIGQSKKDEKPTLSPQQQQQKQQRGDKPGQQAEKHASRYDSDEEEQRYQQHRAVYTIARGSNAKAAEDQERRRRSWDEALPSLDVANDTAHRDRESYSPSGGSCSTCGYYDNRGGKQSRPREAVREWRASHSPDAFEGRIAMAAEEEEKWTREQQEREARFRVKAKEDKAERGREASFPAPLPGTSNNNNNNNKKGHHSNRPWRGPKSSAQNKSLGSKGEGKKGHVHVPKTKAGHQNQQRHERRSFGQQPRRGLPLSDSFDGEIATVAATKAPAIRESKSQARTPKPKQPQTQQRNSQSLQQTRGRSYTTSTPTAAQRRISYSPDAFDDEIAMAAAVEAEKWKREQAQAVKVTAKATSGSPKGSQYIKRSGRTKTGGDKVQNLIDI